MTRSLSPPITERGILLEQCEVLDVLWRAMGLSGVVWECVWYRCGRAFEFRIHRADDETDIIAVRRFAEISEEMQGCARQWLDVAATKGFVRLDD
jgi:hypothetical protein